jgi:hypothetical protein
MDLDAMITEKTLDAADREIEQLLNIVRDRRTTSAAWETVIMLQLEVVAAIVDTIYQEIEQ